MPSNSQNGKSTDDKSTQKEPDWYAIVWDRNLKGPDRVGPLGWTIVGLLSALLLVLIIIVVIRATRKPKVWFDKSNHEFMNDDSGYVYETSYLHPGKST